MTVNVCFSVSFFYQYPSTAAAIMTITAICTQCGITKKSGEMSCCGRGGSWFGNCGSTGDIDFDHTWHEGLQACKAQTQSKVVVGQQLNEAPQQRNGSSNGDVNANFRTVVASARLFVSTTSADIATDHNNNDNRLMVTSQGCKQVFYIPVHISLLPTVALIKLLESIPYLNIIPHK